MIRRLKRQTKRKRPRTIVVRHELSPPGIEGPVNKWMELRRSPIHGLGAFARRDIPIGARIIEYRGEKINNDVCAWRYPDAYKFGRTLKDLETPFHTVVWFLNSKWNIDATFNGNAARFFNHACLPTNCEVLELRGRLWVTAREVIPAGAELVYDYRFDDDPRYTDIDYQYFACHCGKPWCRGTMVERNA